MNSSQSSMEKYRGIKTNIFDHEVETLDVQIFKN